jgi:hypothetical protein
MPSVADLRGLWQRFRIADGKGGIGALRPRGVTP